MSLLTKEKPDMQSKYIQSKSLRSLGIELECGVLSSAHKQVSQLIESGYWEYANEGRDSSLLFQSDEGEEPIVPVEYRIWDKFNNNLWSVSDFIDKMYNKYHILVNDTCGFHIHVSFVDATNGLAIASSQKFQEGFISEYLKAFEGNSKYLDRLNNKYTYWGGYNEDIVVDVLNNYHHDDRRRVPINLMAWHEHNTIEFRVFPHQESALEAFSTIGWLASTVDKLVDEYEKETTFEYEIDMDKYKKGGQLNSDDTKVHVKVADTAGLSDKIIAHGRAPIQLSSRLNSVLIQALDELIRVKKKEAMAQAQGESEDDDDTQTDIEDDDYDN